MIKFGNSCDHLPCLVEKEGLDSATVVNSGDDVGAKYRILAGRDVILFTLPGVYTESGIVLPDHVTIQPDVIIGTRIDGTMANTAFRRSWVPDGPSYFLDTAAHIERMHLRSRVNSVTQRINGLATPTGAIHCEINLANNPDITISWSCCKAV